MIEVTRTRLIHSAPEPIFATLSDPANLASMLPRVRSVEILERHADWARLATHMAFGPFGTVRNEGEARWRDNSEITFVSRTPILVETHWSLVPSANGTVVSAQLRLDLAPLIGPLAAFVPPAQVIGMIAPELDSALAALAQRVETGITH